MKKLFLVFTSIITLNSLGLGTMIHIPGDYPDIQAGIDASVNGDTVLVADGAYTGAGNRNINFTGKAIVVVSENGADDCIIDCQMNGRGFDFVSGEESSSILSGFTIINGSAEHLTYDRGGAIYIFDSSPKIEDCIFTGNSAVYGAAAYIGDNSDAIIENCIFAENSSEGNGGAIFFYGTDAVISGCEIVSNTAGYYGGAICCDEAYPTIENCIISGNSAWEGGGIGCGTFSFPTIENCDIIENTSTMSGGGIHCYKLSSPIVAYCNIIGNSAGNWSGGGIYTSESGIEIGYTVIALNTAGDGGGICFEASDPTITNCTISGNTALREGGGIHVSPFSNTTIINTIVEGNFGEGGIHFNYTTNGIITFSDFANNQNGDFSGDVPGGLGTIFGINANGDSCDAFYNIYLEPLFQTITGDSAFHLTEDSPCIDAGDPVSGFDPDSTIVDMGAFYFHQSVWTRPEQSVNTPSGSGLKAYPNPFNASTAISYQLLAVSYVNLTIYDIAGREVIKLVDSYEVKGLHEVTFDAKDLSSGVYFVRLTAGDFREARKMLLIK